MMLFFHGGDLSLGFIALLFILPIALLLILLSVFGDKDRDR